MAGYFETLAFGAGPVNLKEVGGATESFLGTVVDTTKQIQTSAAAAKGLNWGSKLGSYRMRLVVDVKLNQKIAIAKATHIEFKLYESDDNATFDTDPVMTVRMPISQLNKLKKTPGTFSVVTTNKKYICLSFKFVGGSVASSDKVTAGNMIVTANPSTF